MKFWRPGRETLTLYVFLPLAFLPLASHLTVYGVPAIVGETLERVRKSLVAQAFFSLGWLVQSR